MPKGNSTDVDVPTSPAQGMMQRLASQAALEASITVSDADVKELVLQRLNTIAEADTLDALFDANTSSTLPSAKEASEKGPLTILELEFRRPQEKFAEAGIGAYAYVQSIDDRGEVFDWTTGAPNIVATLYRIQELGLLGKPEKPRIKIMSRVTGSGNTLYSVGRPV